MPTKIHDILEPADITQALEELQPELDTIQAGANQSTKYDLLWRGLRFPPKVVISKALELKTGRPYPVSEFSGGEAPGLMGRLAGDTVWGAIRP